MEELKPPRIASEEHHLAIEPTERLHTQHKCLLNRTNRLLRGTRLHKALN